MTRFNEANIIRENYSVAELFSNPTSFECFFKSNFVSLCMYCQFKFGFNFEQSRDIVHNSFMKLWESRQVLKPESPVHPVLYKIIINNSLDIRKHDKVKRKHEQRFAQHEISRLDTDELERIEYRQLGEDIQKAIATLPEQMQKIFKLCKYEGLTYPKVAQQLNLSVKTVEKQMSRAFFKLRKSLSAYLE